MSLTSPALSRTLVSDNSSVKYAHSEKSYALTVGVGALVSLEYVGSYRIDLLNKSVEFKLGGTYTVLINAVGGAFHNRDH